MNAPARTALKLLASLLVAGSFVACSKEDSAAAKVDVGAMTTALKSDDKDVRINACIELAKAKEKAAPAVDSLIPLLKDPDPLARRLAAYALGQVGAQASRAVPMLKELLQDKDNLVVSDAVNALKAIDPKGFNDMRVYNVSGPFEPPPAPAK